MQTLLIFDFLCIFELRFRIRNTASVPETGRERIRLGREFGIRRRTARRSRRTAKKQDGMAWALPSCGFVFFGGRTALVRHTRIVSAVPVCSAACRLINRCKDRCSIGGRWRSSRRRRPYCRSPSRWGRAGSAVRRPCFRWDRFCRPPQRWKRNGRRECQQRRCFSIVRCAERI